MLSKRFSGALSLVNQSKYAYSWNNLNAMKIILA